MKIRPIACLIPFCLSTVLGAAPLDEKPKAFEARAKATLAETFTVIIHRRLVGPQEGDDHARLGGIPQPSLRLGTVAILPSYLDIEHSAPPRQKEVLKDYVNRIADQASGCDQERSPH